MPWVKMPGLPGLVFEPEAPPANSRKHNCLDCFSCQMCSDARCGTCLKAKHCRSRKRARKKK